MYFFDQNTPVYSLKNFHEVAIIQKKKKNELNQTKTERFLIYTDGSKIEGKAEARILGRPSKQSY